MNEQERGIIEAVSPVIGVVLLVGITVILAVVVGTVVLDFQPPATTTVQGGFSITEDPAAGSVTVQLTASSTADRYIVRTADGETHSLTTVGETVTIATEDDISIIAVKDGSETVVKSYQPQYITLAQYPDPWGTSYGTVKHHASSAQEGPQTLALDWTADKKPWAIVDGVIYASGRYEVQAVSAENGSILWTESTSDYIPHVAYNDEKVFVTEDSDITARAATTGEFLWNATPGDNLENTQATVHDGVVYVPWNQDYVSAYDAETGTELWTSSVSSTFIVESPAYADGILYQRTHRDQRRGLLAIDAKTGENLWSSGSDGYIDGSPMVYGDDILIVSRDGNLYSIDAKSGTLNWNHQLTADSYEPYGAIQGDTFYAAPNGDNEVIAYNLESNSVTWRVTLPGEMTVYTRPVVAGETMYVGKRDYDANAGAVHAIDTADGTILDTYQTGYHLSNLIPYGDSLYLSDSGLIKLSEPEE